MLSNEKPSRSVSCDKGNTWFVEKIVLSGYNCKSDVTSAGMVYNTTEWLIKRIEVVCYLVQENHCVYLKMSVLN